MYRQGTEALQQGLSLGARLLLAIPVALIGAGMIAMAPTANAPLDFYGMGAFCLAIALACALTGAARRMVGRAIGATVFGLAAWYVISQLLAGDVVSNGRHQPSLLNALLFLFAAGVPGLLYALFGRFTWRRVPEEGR